MDAELKARLLASIATGRLVLLCGAGLSMAPPSSLPSAKAVANGCFDKYRLDIDPACNVALRDDLEALAEHFVQLGTLHSVFIDHLVPWGAFMQPPNPGHAAVADFLLCRAAASALSANFDIHIERRAWDYGADFEGSLDGDQATVRAQSHSPLLKFHGCAQRDRGATVWTKSQLNDPVIEGRIAKSKIWMEANLREKDLLVIGFWSDWAYFNEILGRALRDVRPLSITVVDPSAADQLAGKAPDLWAIAHAAQVSFQHVQESGATFLDELRRAFSQSFLRKMLHAGKAALEAETGAACEQVWLEAPEFESEALYGWRRDAEGIAITSPAKNREPIPGEILGLVHLLLRRRGAVASGVGYSLDGRSIRVVNGAGALLGIVRERFNEAPALAGPDIVVCAGATDFGLPDNIVRAGRLGDIVRPAPGSIWVDILRAREMLGF